MYAVIIQARNNSFRLPGKMIKSFYNGKTILEIIIANLQQHLKEYPIILATTSNSSDDAIVELIKNQKVSIFRGDERNVLKRMIDAAKEFGCKNIIRVCADNPFLDMNSILNLIEVHKNSHANYVSYIVGESKPAILSHFGFYAELTTSTTLEKVYRITEAPFYLEHVTNYIYTHPEKFNLHFIQAPPYIFNRSDIRLTVDTIEDFYLAQSLYASMIENEWNHRDLITFIDSNPEILNSMKQMIENNSK